MDEYERGELFLNVEFLFALRFDRCLDNLHLIDLFLSCFSFIPSG